MYENYASMYPPIDLTYLDGPVPTPMTSFDWIPAHNDGVFIGYYHDQHKLPLYNTDWRDEALSWHLTCSIYWGISPSPVTFVKGPDATRFLRDVLVNNVDKWEVGQQKHGITLTEDGNVATHGISLKTGENEYELWWHAPYIDYLFSLKDYDATCETGIKFTLQMSGPNSEKIIEEACGESIADIPYVHFRNATIAGHTIRILRFGMTGNLGFEVQGEMDDMLDVYKVLIEVGNKYGIREIGFHCYCMNHNEGGYPNASEHFMSASMRDEGFLAWQRKQFEDEYNSAFEGGGFDGQEESFDFCGTADDRSIESYFFNPIELGLGYCINWNHDFRGKQALLDYKASGHTRNIVTLEWNVEDIIDVYRSQWDLDEEPYFPIDDMSYTPPKYTEKLVAPLMKSPKYKVFKGDKEVGVAFMHTHSPYYRRIIQLAVIDDDQREIGNELEVLFGEEGFRCKRIRATVEKFPYNKHHERTGLSL